MVETGTATEIGGRIIDKCVELGALLFGDFTLTSGEKSGFYFDGRLLTLSPEGSNLVADAVQVQGHGVPSIVAGHCPGRRGGKQLDEPA